MIGNLLRDPSIRLVTLTGPGGVGKTRLAVHVAQTLEGRYADRVAFVPLAVVSSAAEVASAIADALGIRETGDQPLSVRLADGLRDLHLLLILDNVEHVTDAAPLLASLLGPCPRLTILATGRAPLHLSSEHVVSIPPLNVPRFAGSAGSKAAEPAEAVRLFVARAQAAKHDFTVMDDNAEAIAKVVSRLDGLPLAIELAAARIAHLSPTALLARLEHLIPVLTGGHRDLPARQQTIEATIAWSYDLLTPSEQLLFRRLAVFVGGCTLDAAERVAGEASFPSDSGSGTLSVLDGVASLVAKSLLRQEAGPNDEPRFAMLETVRQFGLDRLEATGEADHIRTRHAGWFVDLAEQADPAIFGGPDHRLWLDRLEADLANLRAALAWLRHTDDNSGLLRLAAGLGGLWHFRSYSVEGCSWMLRAMATDDGGAPLARSIALVKLALFRQPLPDRDLLSMAEEAIAIRREQQDWRGLPHALCLFATLLRDVGDDARALEAVNEATAIFQARGDRQGLAMTRSFLARNARASGNEELADALLQEAHDLYALADYEYGQASILLLQGVTAANKGKSAEAASYFACSLHLWRAVGNRKGMVDTLAETSGLALSRAHAAAAVRLSAAASVLAESIGYSATDAVRTQRASVITAARAALGPDSFTAAWEHGRALSLEEALAAADAVLSSMTQVQERPDVSSPAGLTPRELDVLRLLAAGQTNIQIGDALFISPRTAQTHITRIIAKVGATNRTEAAAYAHAHGLA